MNMNAGKLYSAFEKIRNDFSGELYYGDESLDRTIRMAYATDASVYQEYPIAVAIPENKEDIKLLADFANQRQVTLIPRAAGTSLAGQF